MILHKFFKLIRFFNALLTSSTSLMFNLHIRLLHYLQYIAAFFYSNIVSDIYLPLHILCLHVSRFFQLNNAVTRIILFPSGIEIFHTFSTLYEEYLLVSIYAYIYDIYLVNFARERCTFMSYDSEIAVV